MTDPKDPQGRPDAPRWIDEVTPPQTPHTPADATGPRLSFEKRPEGPGAASPTSDPWSQMGAAGSAGPHPATSDVSSRKLIAGLLGIFLGSLGVHKFYLGQTQAGIIMLAVTLGGWFLGIIGSLIIVGAVFFLLPFAMSVVGLIEGILYLTKSDADFEREYLVGKKPWL